MPTTIELPDDLAARLAALLPEGEQRNRFAIAAIAGALAEAEQTHQSALPLRAPSDYPSEAAYVTAAVSCARAHGLDPDTCAGIARGLAQADAGRTLSLDEARARADDALASIGAVA